MRDKLETRRNCIGCKRTGFCNGHNWFIDNKNAFFSKFPFWNKPHVRILIKVAYPKGVEYRCSKCGNFGAKLKQTKNGLKLYKGTSCEKGSDSHMLENQDIKEDLFLTSPHLVGQWYGK